MRPIFLIILAAPILGACAAPAVRSTVKDCDDRGRMGLGFEVGGSFNNWPRGAIFNRSDFDLYKDRFAVKNDCARVRQQSAPRLYDLDKIGGQPASPTTADARPCPRSRA